ncbi:phage tail terminator protein [Providencia manganoxydans]|uniref:phage tail terminator protein n=1 Tax=Providencia manganoxydans TaxID=2923283 RepID=UPI0032DB61C3
MIKHTKIRNIVIDGLKPFVGEATIYDGRVVSINENEFPVIAVYLTDVQPSPKYLDTNGWNAVLHIELFLKSSQPDAKLDEWVESKLFPAVAGMKRLGEAIDSITQQGFNYARDDEMSYWASVDLTYFIEYEM